MKPDWKDAPEWASYLAMDQSGDWYWFEARPFQIGHEWSGGAGNMEFTGTCTPWSATMCSRP